MWEKEKQILKQEMHNSGIKFSSVENVKIIRGPVYPKPHLRHNPFSGTLPRQTLTSPLDSVLCLIGIYHALFSSHTRVPEGSPSRGGDVAVYVLDITQPSLPTYLVLVSICHFMALSTVFHSINSPDNSPLSHCVLPVFSPDAAPSDWLGSKHQPTS